METISRQQFLQHTAMASAAVLLSSLEGFALTMEDKKIKVAVIGCGSVSTQYLPHLSKAKFVEIVSVIGESVRIVIMKPFKFFFNHFFTCYTAINYAHYLQVYYSVKRL